MNRRDLASLVCVATLAACGPAEKPAPPPAPEVAATEQRAPGLAVREQALELSATVEAIDQDTRMVTLLRSDGERVSLRVDDSVRNLAEVKAGDLVVAKYYESVAVRLRKPGEAEPGVSASTGVSRAEPGEKPGGAEVRSITIVATIRAVDREKQTATLEGTDGRLQTIAVRDPRNFDVAGVGDVVELTYTEGLAIEVEKPAAQ